MATAAEKRAERAANKIATEAAGKEAARKAGEPPPPTEAQLLNAAQIQRPIPTQMASGEVAKPQVAGGKVYVGCKLGITSYAIQISQIIEKDEQSPLGMRTIKESIRVGPVVVLRGTAYPRGTPPKGFPEAPVIVAGAAMTIVDRDFWVEWLKVNARNPVVVNKMVFGAETFDEFQGMARELAKELSGLDPLDPTGNDPRMPKSSRKDEVLELEAGQK